MEPLLSALFLLGLSVGCRPADGPVAGDTGTEDPGPIGIGEYPGDLDAPEELFDSEFHHTRSRTMLGEPGAIVPEDDWWPDAYAIFSSEPYHYPVSPAVVGEADRCWRWSEVLDGDPTTRDLGMRILVTTGEDLIRLDRAVSTDGEDIEYWWAPKGPVTYGAEPGSELSLDGHDLGIAVADAPENVNWDEVVTGLLSGRSVTLTWDPPGDGSQASWLDVGLAPARGDATDFDASVGCILVDDGVATLDISEIMDGYDGFWLDIGRTVMRRVEVPDYGAVLADAYAGYYYVTYRNR